MILSARWFLVAASLWIFLPFLALAAPDPLPQSCQPALKVIAEVDPHAGVPEHLIDSPLRYEPPAANLAVVPGTSIPHKASWIAAQADMQGTIAEIGGGQKVAELIHTSSRPRFLFNAVSPYDMAASDDRYGRAGTTYDPADYISRARVERQLQVELDGIQAAKGLRRFVIADTVSTSRGNGQGWMGFQGELVAGQKPVRIVLHVRLLGPTSANQKLDLGSLGVNLVFGAYHYLRNPLAFLRSLLHGIAPGQVQIDVYHIEGPGTEAFKKLTPASALLDTGLSPYCLLSPEGELVSAQAALGRKNLQIENGELFAAPEGTPAGDAIDVRVVSRFTAKDATRLPPQRYVLVGADTDPNRLRAYVDGIRPPKREKNPDATASLITAARDVIDWKARIVNIYDELKGSIFEIGIGHRIAGRVFEAPFCHTLFETAYFPALDKATRFSETIRFASAEDAARKIIDQEVERVRYHKPHRKFSMATITNLQTEGSITGVMALAVQLEKDGPVSRVFLKFSIPAAERLHQSEVVGALGVNLLYGMYHYLDRPEVFFRSLLHGVRVENAQLESIAFEGAALIGLDVKKNLLNRR